MSETDFANDKVVSEIEASIGLKQGYFGRLLYEDDWSFVIKLHAFIEAMCTHLLIFHFQEPELHEVISRLELSNKSCGKIKFLEKLGLIGKENRRFIASLSELRNRLVHDIRNGELSLINLINELDRQGLKNFAVSFSPSESVHRKILKDPILGKHLPPSRMDEQAKNRKRDSKGSRKS